MITTTLSSKGQVVLPRLVRSRLQLSPGAKLKCEIRGDSIVLTPEVPIRTVRSYTIDERTGLQVVETPDGMEPITSKIVKKILEDHP